MKLLKRTLALTLSAAMVLGLLSGCGSDVSANVLNVYNWGEYIDTDLLDRFEQETGIKVIYNTFDSNENLYSRIQTTSYDVIIPSDYAISRFIDEDMLQPLNFDNIPNMKYIDEKYTHLDFDPEQKYSVPYTWGVVGIVYNTKYVDEADTGSWDLLWNLKYTNRTAMFNNSRDAFGSAQYLLGLDVNSDSEADWRQALEKLKEQKRVVQGYVMDEIYNKLENGSAAIASYYAGDFMTMYEENEDLEFYYPSEGTNLYVDAMCIPTSAKNKLIAERYIDFMLTEEPAVANAEYTYYGSPNRLVRENEEYIEYMNSIKDGGFDLMYDTDNVQATAYENLTPEKLALLNQLWEELKSDIDISTGIYVICGVIIAVMAGFGVCFAVRRKIRNIY